MELFPAEAKQLAGLIHEWFIHPEYELESTFGIGGRVDGTTFTNIAQRLTSKGYRGITQEDRLTVMTPEHIRFTLQSMGVIQQYCLDDIMNGKPFIALIKDRAMAEGNVDLEEYNTRFKLRREIPMGKSDEKLKSLLGSWQQQRKAFRMIRRWSYEAPGLHFDLSIVRSTKQDSRGEYRWQRRFRDQDIMKESPIYEVEVELTRLPDDTEEAAMKRLIKGVGEILRGIQKNSILLRKSTRRRVMTDYEALTATKLFRGPPPYTLEMKNFQKERTGGDPNIRDGYNVTDKADGLRCLGFVDTEGELFLIDMALNVYRTSLIQPNCRMSLLDGEWVTRNYDNKPVNQYLMFDIFYSPDKKDVSQLPFKAERQADCRHGRMEIWMQQWASDEGAKTNIASLPPTSWLQVSMKTFKFGKADDVSIFKAASQVLDVAKNYHTDGLIFTPNDAPMPPVGMSFKEQFKWKPAKDNTIDFLVKFEKDNNRSSVDKIKTEVKPGTNETVSYKTLILYVGSSSDQSIRNSRDYILYKRGAVAKAATREKYRAVPFSPIEYADPAASICNLPLEEDFITGEAYVSTGHTAEPILDESIVEMAYEPSQPAGWRWKPLRVRMDKTEKFQRGILSRTLNSEETAEGIWNSIHDPITENMIRTGKETSKGEIKKELQQPYFERKDQIRDINKVSGLREFHNRWIKEKILLRVGLKGGGRSILDFSAGKGADMQKWFAAGAAFCFGIDIDADCILNTKDGAYRRIVNIQKRSRVPVPPTIFCIGDCTKAVVTGDAGATDEDKDIMRAVFGRMRPVGPVPPYITDVAAGKMKEGADCIASMFAIHYMFKNSEMFDGFLKNLNDCLKVGGYFVGCTFDGEKVFQLLENVPLGGKKVGMEADTEVWSITKQYDEDEPNDFGLAIDVKFLSIGTTQREYLVPFKLLESRMKQIGCDLLNAKELQELGLQSSSATFNVSFDMTKGAYSLSPVEKEFSFLNRWFIFKRRTQIQIDKDTSELMEAVAKVTLEREEKPIEAAVAVPKIVRAAADAMKTDKRDGSAEDVLEEMQLSATKEAIDARPLEKAVEKPKEKSEDIYKPDDIFLFYANAAASKDLLKIGDKLAGRWLALNAPFAIDDDGKKYPSIEHYLAAMRFKLASNKPQLAATIFSQEGTIHQKYVRRRLVDIETMGVKDKTGTKVLPEKREAEMLEDELEEVKTAIRPSQMKKERAEFDENKWATVKDKVLQTALKYRWDNDKRFHTIVEAARNQNKTLLYYTAGTSSSDLGGIFKKETGKIVGENKVGKIIMKLANYPGFT